MQNRVVRTIFSIAGALVGFSFATGLGRLDVYLEMISSGQRPLWLHALILVVSTLLFAFIFYLVSTRVYAQMQKASKVIEQRLNKLQMADIVFACVGLVVGLTISYFISGVFKDYLIAPFALILSIILYVSFGFFGARLFMTRWHELPMLTDMKRPDRMISERIAANQAGRNLKSAEGAAVPKLLDSSALIDGRIIDIYKTGFMEGKLIVPRFILEELQKVADSSDSLKRKRGRRGLDVVMELQKLDGIDISLSEYENDSADEVDMKLLKLAQQLGGRIMTNDYNLNRVSELSGVHVLNINELSNALKPALVSGEEMRVLVTKEGREQNQGIAYLDDGTMIVIENGRALIGEEVPVIVTSILQTAAGRMIFAKPKDQVDA